MLNVWFIGLSVWLLFGCDGPDQQRLHAVLHPLRNEARPIVIASFAEEKPEAYNVDGIAMRDPFVWQQTESASPSVKELLPFLERFALENLQLVGVISSGLGNLALVRSALGVHPIRVGQRIGLNTGVVANIAQDRIDVDISVGSESTFRRQTLNMKVNK